MKKVLNCFVVLVILMSAIPIFVTQSNAVMPVDIYMGKVTGKNNDVLTVQIEYKPDYSNLPPKWVSYSTTSQWTILNSNAINEIRVGDYIEISGFLGVNNEGESICIGKMKSSTEKVITDVYGDPDYLVPVHAFIEHPGVLNPPLMGNYIIIYENIPDCSKYPSGSFACNVEAIYSDVTISKGNEQLKSQRLYPGRSFKYEDRGRGYNIDITFNSGEAPAYPDCTDQPCFGPQAFSDFTIHIKKMEVKKPDLIIQDISWSPSNPKQGDTVTINIITKNKGSGNAGGFDVCYYADGSYYDRDYVSSLSAGSTTTTSFKWTAKCGNHAIKAVADCYNAVAESNEENNWMSKGGLNIPCKPDLIIEDIYWQPENPKQGDTMTFYVYIKNQGSGSAGTSTVKYYIDGSYVTSDSVPAFSAGSAESTQTFTWTANKCGDVQVKAIADATNAVDEGSNEGNNERTKTVSIICLFYIRPACQDVNGNHLDDVSYEFVDYSAYKGTCDYNEYLLAPGHGTYKVKFTKGNLEATVTLESHLKSFAGTVVTLREKEGSIYATSTPSGANVYLDGTYKSTSAITIPNVPVGSHTVKFTKTGYKDCEKTVTVYANQQRSVHCDLDFTPEHITIGELVEKLEKGPESVVDKKFVTSGWVLVSTHEGYKGIEILWKILRIVSQIGSGGIVDIGKVPPQWLAPNFMVIWPNSIQDQNFCDSHKAFPYIEAYAASEDLWANSWDVVNMKGVVKKKNILWYTFYQFEVEEMDINPEYSDLEELLKSNEGDHVKFMCVVNKSLKVEIISPLGLCGSLHIQPKQTIDIPYQALVKVEGTIKDIKTIEEEGKERYEYYLEAESVEKILTVKEPSVKTAQTQTIAMQCPVNATITDQYGRIISDDGTNEIPDADMIVMEDMKIFYLPADLRYSVDIDAYDTGTFNFTRVSPIGNDISITKFENIPVTSNTKASVEIEPGVTDYTMSIDYNGDGVTDEVRSPDVSETVEVTTPTTIVFEDDFSELNLNTWIPFGSPSPHVLASAEGRTGVFDNNGDGWCNSGIVSKDNFSFPNGFTMESDMYLDVTNVAGCWNSPVIGLTRQNKPTGEGVCPNEDYLMGVIFGIEYDGDACWGTPPEQRRHAYFIIRLYTKEGTWESVSWLNADDYTDAWHNFKIAVGSDRNVKFYVDNELIYISEKRINETVLQEKKIFLGIRSSGSAGKSYHDYVKVYSGIGGEKESNVRFKGIAYCYCLYWNDGYGIEVTNILSDPDGKLAIGNSVCACWAEDTLAQINNISLGDVVEVCGSLKEYPDITEGWKVVFLESLTHHLKLIRTGNPSKLDIEIASDKKIYAPNDAVTIMITVTNTGNEPISIVVDHYSQVSLIDPYGEIIGRGYPSIKGNFITLSKDDHATLTANLRIIEDAREGFYDVKVSLSDNKYVKTAKDLFFVKA